MTKKTAKKPTPDEARRFFVRDLERAYEEIPDTDRRVGDALRAILEATLDAVRKLDEDEATAIHELEALKRSLRKHKPHAPAAAEETPVRKKTDERSQFLQTLRHSLSSWRLPPPSPARRHPPTLRDIAAQLSRTLDHDHVRKIAEDAGVIPPPMSDYVDRILHEWTKHIESHGEYQLGDAGSERMIVDAFRGVGLPRRAAEGLYEFAHRKKRAH